MELVKYKVLAMTWQDAAILYPTKISKYYPFTVPTCTEIDTVRSMLR